MDSNRRGGERPERRTGAWPRGRVRHRLARWAVAATSPRAAASVVAFAVLSAGVELACSSATDTIADGRASDLSDADVPFDAGSDAGPPAPPACGIDGGTTAFESCPTFAVDIYPKVAATGKWQCASAGCHGGTMTPTIDGTSAADCLASLRAITIDGRPYLTSDAGGDPREAAMMCNVQGTCGTKMPPTGPLTIDELCLIDVWLRCGAR